MATSFELLQPRTLGEALAALQEEGALPLAGGTDLLIQIRRGRKQAARLVSLTGIPSLAGIRISCGEVRLGALTRVRDIEASSELRRAASILPCSAALLGSWQVRNLATVGGNLANGASSADTARPLLVLDAQVSMSCLGGQRELPLMALYRGPGQTCLERGEVLTEISFQVPEGAWGASDIKFSPRRAMDIANVGVAALVRRVGERVVEARIALGAVAPVPMRVPEAETALAGHPASTVLWEEAGRIAASLCRPREGGRLSPEYRRHLVAILTARALSDAWERSQDGGYNPG